MAAPLDPLLNPPAAPASPTSVVGAPGFAIYGGFLVEGEKDPTLQGREKYLTFADLVANTTIVAAGVRLMLNLVGKAEWTVAPADDSAEALKLAQRVQGMLHGMNRPWSRTVKRAAMAKFYGFALLEWTVRLAADGVIELARVDSRAQHTIERWDVDVIGDVRGAWQRSPQTQREIYLPRWKLVHIVDDSLNDTPEGMGLFRHVVEANKRLKRYELLEGWGFETDLRGIPVGKAPLAAIEASDLDEAAASAVLEPLKSFIRKHNKNPALGLILDSAPYRAAGELQTPSGDPQWSIDLMKGDAGPHEEMAAAIERTNREIARVLGVEHLLLGSNDRGSYAMASSKAQSFGMIVDSALTDLREAFQADLLGPIWALNGWDPALKPKLVTSQAQYRDLAEITTSLRDLAQAGATLMPDDPVINQVRAIAGLVPQPADLAAEAKELALSDQTSQMTTDGGPESDGEEP